MGIKMKKNNPIPNVIIYKDNAGGDIFSDETYITTELGGEGHRLRNYVVISTLIIIHLLNDKKI